MTPEQELYSRYMELGRIERDAKAERDAIKQSEILPLLRQGVFLGNDGRGLRTQLEVRFDFDWQRAAAAGDIPQEVVKKYLTPKIITKVVDAKFESEQAWRHQERETLERAIIALNEGEAA